MNRTYWNLLAADRWLTSEIDVFLVQRLCPQVSMQGVDSRLMFSAQRIKGQNPSSASYKQVSTVEDTLRRSLTDRLDPMTEDLPPLA
jgi:hypothetical protein